MSSYTPRSRGLPRCTTRDAAKLVSAADALGKTLVMGSELSFELQALARNPKHPFHANGEAWVGQTFMLLQGMLIAERWLIEFLLGPELERGGKKRPTDICVDYFKYDWRFPKGPVADELAARRTPINKLVLHPTWQLLNAAPRKWTLNRIARCIEGLNLFADELQKTLPDVARTLKSHVRTAQSVMSAGRSDGFRWFDLGPLVGCLPTDDTPRYESST